MAPFDGQPRGLKEPPRAGEPESAMLPGMAAPVPTLPARAQIGPPASRTAPAGPTPRLIADTSLSGPGGLQVPLTWLYDFDPASGAARASFPGIVNATIAIPGGPFLPLAGGTLSGTLGSTVGPGGVTTAYVGDVAGANFLAGQGGYGLTIYNDFTGPGLNAGHVTYNGIDYFPRFEFYATGDFYAVGTAYLGSTNFTTPAPASEDKTGATTAFVKQHGATATAQRTTFPGIAIPNTGVYTNGPTTGPIGAAGQVWYLLAVFRLDFGGTAGTVNFFQLRIFDGVNTGAPSDSTVTVAGGNNSTFVVAKVVTLTGAATYTMQAETSQVAGTFNTDSHFVAIRLA